MTTPNSQENLEHLLLSMDTRLKTIKLKIAFYEDPKKEVLLTGYSRQEQIKLLEMAERKYEKDLQNYVNGRGYGD